MGSANVPALPPQPPPPPRHPGNAAFELYKLEYERAAIRYNEIYVAIWQIFYFLVVVSGAILTFGGDRFQADFLVALACFPLVFWYLAIFQPHDRYGDDCGDRLARMEKLLNTNYGTHLAHYIDFEKRKEASFWKKTRRVRYRVGFFFFFIVLLFLAEVYKSYSLRRSDVPLIREKTSETKVIALNPEELKKLVCTPGAAETKAK